MLRIVVVAATFSGVPSTVHAVLTGRDPLAATRAAGTLLPGRRPNALAGLAVHLVVSAGWTVVLAAVDRRRRLGVRGGAVAGALIAALDLEVLGRGYPAIRALPRWPQWLDHVAFGALVGGLLAYEGEAGGCTVLVHSCRRHRRHAIVQNLPAGSGRGACRAGGTRHRQRRLQRSTDDDH